MKNYTISGSTGSRDIVHMRANKDAYDITSEQPNELTYTSKMGDRQYVMSTSIESLKFKHTDSEGVNKFGWDTAYEAFATKKTCKAYKDAGYNNSGVYTIKPVDVEYQVYCDMTTDGGGWTLVAYAGTINSTKENTTGQAAKYFQPLIFKWGAVQTNSLTSKTSFSRFDIVKPIVKSTDEIRARRTSNQNTLIFPITNTSWFGREATEGQFTITSTNRNLAYLKLNNGTGLKTVSNGTKWSYLDSNSGSYPGIDWNVSEGDNCDNCGRSYTSGLNHRSLLYWETNSGSYSDDQWFHASPMSLADSTTPDNNVQDIEFWYREV